MRSKWLKIASFTLTGLLFAPLSANAGLTLTVDAPGVQSSQVPGVITETFNGFAPGSYTSLVTAVGTFTAPAPGLSIQSANLYGGAGGSGNYMAIGAQSGQLQADLALNAPASYLGVWLSAEDAKNSVEIYSGATLLATYNYAAINALDNGNSAYLGNPNSDLLGQDGGERFAYFNITATGGTTFDKVVFGNADLSTGNELDNISILPATTTTTAVPLPSAGWAGLGLLGCLGLIRLFRRLPRIA